MVYLSITCFIPVDAGMRGHSSVGRASRWHREGQGFEPPCLHGRFRGYNAGDSATGEPIKLGLQDYIGVESQLLPRSTVRWLYRG